MENKQEIKMVKHLNTALSDPLALYVGEITDKGAIYETPDEYILDLVRLHMEEEQECREIKVLLTRSFRENDYSEWTDGDLADARKIASE